MRLRLHLAEVPTDVLVWLVDAEPEGGTRERIAEALAPVDGEGRASGDTLRAVARALRLLHELQYVKTTGSELRLLWHPTVDGIAAVRAARDSAPGEHPA